MISPDKIALAVIAAAHHYGVDPVEAMNGKSGLARVRLAAAIGIAKAAPTSNRAAGRLLGIASASALSPSTWPKHGVTQVAIDLVIDVLNGAPVPPKPKVYAHSARPCAKGNAAPTNRSAKQDAAITIDVVARRQRERMMQTDIAFRRTDQDRKPIKGTVTAKLMGDPPADREAASEAARARLARHEARFKAEGVA